MKELFWQLYASKLFFRGTAARIKVTTMIEEMFETGELSVGSDEDTDLT